MKRIEIAGNHCLSNNRATGTFDDEPCIRIVEYESRFSIRPDTHRIVKNLVESEEGSGSTSYSRRCPPDRIKYR